MSLIPNTETDLSDSTLALAADVINLLKERDRYFVVETVMQSFLKRHKRVGPSEFFDALTLLFSLGMIEY